MSLHYPRCHSPKVASLHHVMKIGAAIGTLAALLVAPEPHLLAVTRER